MKNEIYLVIPEIDKDTLIVSGEVPAAVCGTYESAVSMAKDRSEKEHTPYSIYAPMTKVYTRMETIIESLMK